MKNWLSIILAGGIMASVLSGCTGGNSTPPANGSSAGGTSSTTSSTASVTATDEVKEVYYEGFLAMRVFENRGDSEPEAYAAMEKMIMDAIGVKAIPVWMPRGSEQEKLNLMIASKDDKLDVIMTGKWSDYAKGGALLPLNDLLDKYGQDIKKGYEPFATMWDQVTDKKSGDIYGVPRTLPLSQHPIWVRQDWLATCGVENPKTVDELEVVLKAFKEKDPAGGGQTIPMLVDIGSMQYGFSGGFTQNGYGYWVDADKKVKPGVMQPGFSDAVAKMADWYKKGYIYPETYALSTQVEKINELILADRVGATNLIYSPICINLPELQKTNPKADYNYVDGFSGPKGICETGQNPASDCVMILKKSQNPEGAMKLLNWMMDKENFISSYAGRVGIDWEWVDKDASTLIRKDAETYDGEFYMFPNNLMLRHLNILASADAKPGLYTKFLTEDSYRTDTVKHAQDYGVTYPNDRLDEMAPNRADVDRIIEEELVKFLTGVRPMSEWERFVTTDLEKAGVAAVIEAYTTIYNEQKA